MRCLVAAGAAFALLIAGVVNPATAAPKPPTVKVKVQFTTPYVSCDPDGDYVRAVAGVLVQPIGPGVKVNRQLTNRDGWVEFALPVGAQVRFGVIYSSKELELRPGSVKSSRYTWFTPPIDVPRVSMQKSFNINSHFAAAVANLWVEARKAVVAARSATVERLPKLIVVSEIDQTFEGRMATLETNFDSDSRGAFQKQQRRQRLMIGRIAIQRGFVFAGSHTCHLSSQCGWRFSRKAPMPSAASRAIRFSVMIEAASR